MSFRVRLLAGFAAVLAPLPAVAQVAEDDSAAAEDKASIVVNATRTQLPPSALPLTIDVIDSEALDRQVQISGSTVDAVSALLPSFSPTREKLSGAGESLRGRSPLYAINSIPQSTPVRDGARDGGRATLDADAHHAISRRAARACAIVTPSAYSRSPPTGRPRAMRVTVSWWGTSCRCT